MYQLLQKTYIQICIDFVRKKQVILHVKSYIFVTILVILIFVLI